LSTATRKNAFSSWSKEAGRKVLESTSSQPGPVLLSLQVLQSKFGYIHQEAVALVALSCNVSRAEVHGVLTFYHDLRRTPPPRHFVDICGAEACQAVGSRTLVEEVQRSLGATLGEVNSEVEVKEKYCLGNCALGPSAVVDGKLIGKCTLEKIRAALARDENI
jgi:formate dehydrogenase subunit gamma